MGNIIVITPEEHLNKEIKKYLEKEGYRTLTAKTAAVGIEKSYSHNPSVFILDINQEDISCRSLCKNLREDFPEVPVLILMDESQIKQYPKYHSFGADDFVIKPLDFEEILARIEVLLSSDNNTGEILKVGNILLDKRTYTVTRNGRSIDLTPQEFKLLKYLMHNKNRVLTRELILSRVWEYDFDAQTRAVDVYISYLRNKLNAKGEKNPIKTVRGFGYIMKDPNKEQKVKSTE